MNKSKSKKKPTSHITTFYITFLISAFIFGLFIGNFFNATELDRIELEVQNNTLNLRSIDQMLKFQQALGVDYCNIDYLNTLKTQITRTGEKLASLESTKSTNNKDYEYLVKSRHINQVALYTEFYRQRIDCDQDQNVILFFFDDSSTSEEAGKKLDMLQQEVPVTIIAMSYGYVEQLDFFYEYYEVNDTPFLKINFEHELISENITMSNILEKINNADD